MNKKIKVGILGATGMVGRNYIKSLADHPWFEISFLAASERSAGKTFAEAVSGKGGYLGDLPDWTGDMPVFDVKDIKKAADSCSMAFSAFSMDKESTRELEKEYAAADLAVVSNNSAHRLTGNVPMLIPEINSHLLDIIPEQRKSEGWKKGLIVCKPNCGLQSYVLPLGILRMAGYKINRIITANLQALSGAGYPGQPALDIIDNIIALPSEEEKAFSEPQKIFGGIENDIIKPDSELQVSSNCVRVAVVHGHTSCVWFDIEGAKPEIDELANVFKSFRGEPQRLQLPSAPDPVIRYFGDDSHPQPVNDRDAGKGMAVTLGRLKKDPVMGYRFTALSHNTVRGAAGGAILSAELLVSKGYITG